MSYEYNDYYDEYDYCEEDCSRHQPEKCEKKKYRPKPNKTVLKCGTPGAVTLPLATLAGTTFNVATVTVDTSKFNKPCIKFEFASNIVATAAALTLNFQIFKQCKNQLVPIPVGPVWTFSRLAEITSSDSFSFFVCDCDSCYDECCTYSVVATVAGIATIGVTSINNAILSAIVVDESCDC
ncbi:MAG TPA: DUF4489 domain-containing protein [Candidatus Merdenecus merdavium]|nr:DUF4489 domain-containing protein [Candidatus Merdenecus merdavium]